MFKPISFNVIRSALAWEGIPKPLSVRSAGGYKWPDGTLSAEVVVSWDGAAVMRFAGRKSLYDGSAAYVKFCAAIKEAFCSDIQPVTAHYEISTDRMTVELYCRTCPHTPDQLPLPLEN